MASDAAAFLEEPGLWVQVLCEPGQYAGRAALFLDRDGTINVDTGYPDNPDDLVLHETVLPVIRTANALGLPVIVVTNQSGIARGYFGWSEFALVTDRLLALLDAEGCKIDMMIACAYHDAGEPPLAVADHPMRKPNPGMLTRAGDLLGIDLAASVIVGDKMSDIEAGHRAGLASGWLVHAPGDGAGGEAGDGFVRQLETAADCDALCAELRQRAI